MDIELFGKSIIILFFVYPILYCCIYYNCVGKKFRIIDNGCGKYVVQKKVLGLWGNMGELYGIYSPYDSVTAAEISLKNHLEYRQEMKEKKLNKGKIIKAFELSPPKTKRQLILEDINYDPLEQIKKSQNYANNS